MIRLTVVDPVIHLFSVGADEPVCVEVCQATQGHLVAEVYHGNTTPTDAEPIGYYDSATDGNCDWEVD